MGGLSRQRHRTAYPLLHRSPEQTEFKTTSGRLPGIVDDLTPSPSRTRPAPQAAFGACLISNGRALLAPGKSFDAGKEVGFSFLQHEPVNRSGPPSRGGCPVKP